MAASWKSRIIGTGEEAPDQLLANPMNFRIHPKEQQSALKAVLDEVGWVDDVIVNKTTGHIIDGHLRVELALRKDEQTIPVKYVELTEDEERIVLAAFDPISAMAQHDKDKINDLLDGIVTDNKKIKDILDIIIGNKAGDTEYDFKDLDEELELLGEIEDVYISVAVPKKYEDHIKDWMANGQPHTGPGFGRGIMKRCKLL